MLTTAQLLAVEVLRGDDAAIVPLLDALLEDRKDAAGQVLYVRKLTVPADRVKIVVYVKDHYYWDESDRQALKDALDLWLSNPDARTISVTGIDRIEIYELPS